MNKCVCCDKEVTVYNSAYLDKIDYHLPDSDEVKTGVYCRSCAYGGLYAYCVKCSTGVLGNYYHYYRKSDMRTNKYTDGGMLYCKFHALQSPAYKTVLRYNDRADKYIGFIGKPDDNMYMGVELEIETPDRAKYKDLIWDLFDNFIIMKTDGSLSDNGGIEIVSAPAPFEIHKTAWNKFLENLPEGIFSHHYQNTAKSATQCGIHIHVSKKAITTLDIGKCAFFVNKITNLSFVSKISGRNGNQYCKYKEIAATDINTYNAESKYEVVNTNPTNTVEFRMFKGTLNKIMFLKNIEFVHALCKFVRGRTVDKLTYAEFITFAVDQQIIYPNLYRVLVHLGFTNGEKEPAKLFENI